MNASSEDIKDMLVADDSLPVILVFGVNLFIGKEPAKPENCVTIYDTPGFPPQLTLNRDEFYEYPSVQIRVRNVKYMDGWNLISSIMVLLHGRAHETWNGTVYSLIQCSGGMALLDWDENNRARFVVNFNIQRR
jgi:hypothetical protein